MLSVEDARRFVAELVRRRVFQVVAIYGGAAFGLLQGADVVIDALSLPRSILTAMTVLVLIGFVVALIVGWVYDLDAAGRLQKTGPGGATTEPSRGGSAGFETAGSSESASIMGAGANALHPPDAAASGDRTLIGWPLRTAAILGIAIAVSGGWLVATRFFPLGNAYAVTDPQGSYLVAPIRSRGLSEEDVLFAGEAATRLMFALRGWDSLRVVQWSAVDGLFDRFGIDSLSSPNLDQAFQMAETVRVGTLIGLHVSADVHTTRLEAVFYDVASQSEIDAPSLITAARGDTDRLVAPVARRVLSIRDQDVSLEELRAESPNLEAHQDFGAGLDALWNWRLVDAEAAFRSAIDEDSLFAVAHHYLALALYWQTARDPERNVTYGPEIARHTRTASRLASQNDLRPGLREHVEALKAFWTGDYDRARSGYRALIKRDPSDTEAWLLLGSVEFTDPYLERSTDGEVRPRSNLNAARRAFEHVVDLSPDFQLSYGHLFDIDRELLEVAVARSGCPLFEAPDAPRLPPYAARQPGEQAGFCPLVMDSITWIPRAEFDGQDLRAAGDRARREMRRSRELLEDWVRIHPNQPRPHEELDRWLSWRRSLLTCSSDTTDVGELTRDISRERELALRLRSDTTADDRGRLAMLRLVEGQVDSALRDVIAASENAAQPPLLAANVFLAGGLTEEALRAVTPAYSGASWSRDDPLGGYISTGDVADLVLEISVRGATGDDGPALRSAFQRLMSAWSGPRYSPRQSVLLREMMLGRGVAPGLLLEPESRRAWFAGWEAAGVSLPDPWRDLAAADGREPPPGGGSRARGAAAALDTMLARVRDATRTDAEDHFMVASFARIIGRDSIAAEHFRRVQACPLSLDDFDRGWGLRTLSRRYLSGVLSEMGDTAAAADVMDGFSALWRGRAEGPGDPIRR